MTKTQAVWIWKNRLAAAMMGAAIALGGADALAQKSADTLRIPYIESISSTGSIFTGQLEGNFIHKDVYEMLLAYDSRTKHIVGQLAESWTRVNPTTYEFNLRSDVTYSNGNKFDADDVVHMINFLADANHPEAKKIVHGQRRFAWLKAAEKISENKVRITVDNPTPVDELQFALAIPIYDAETMKSLPNYSDYETRGIGTGPYKIVQIDPSRGMTAVKNADFKAAAGRRGAARIGTVKMMFMPDLDSQVASLLVGNIDTVKNLQIDQVKNLVAQGFNASPRSEITQIVLEFDAADRSGAKPLQDVRVRRALEMAIDRKTLASLSPAGSYGEVMDAVCFSSMVGCVDGINPPPKFDVEGAKKLLAEAGYPNGFDIVLNSRTLLRDAATGLTGMWRKIGVIASVEMLSPNVMQKKRAAGELAMHLTIRPLFPMPDVSAVLDTYFYNTSRDYSHDEVINKLGEEAYATFDEEKRDRAYKTVFDRINDRAYMLPISSLPVIFLHNKELKIDEDSRLLQLPAVSDFSWN